MKIFGLFFLLSLLGSGNKLNKESDCLFISSGVGFLNSKGRRITEATPFLVSVLQERSWNSVF